MARLHYIWSCRNPFFETPIIPSYILLSRAIIAFAMDPQSPNFQSSLFERVLVGTFRFVNKYVPWHKLPRYIGAVNLDALRIELRANNLHDSYVSGAAQGNEMDDPVPEKRFYDARNSDGKYNSIELPLMGCAGMRFGRNFSRTTTPKPTEEELWNPNPRMLSEKFMTRKPGGFIPATSLNLLAAAWIQFQTHDWFNHESSEESFDIPLPEGDSWPHGNMNLPKTKPDDILHSSDIKCPGYKNTNTSWWDASQIYGSSEPVTQSLRTKLEDGTLLLHEDGTEAFLPRDAAGNVLTGFNSNWWIGMELLHTIFALEHNYICDMLRKQNPDWSR